MWRFVLVLRVAWHHQPTMSTVWKLLKFQQRVNWNITTPPVSIHWFYLSFPLFIVRSCSQSLTNNTYKLAVCQRMGTILYAKDRFMKFFKFDECVNESTHFKYIDFIEMPFEVELDFFPTQLSIHEHIVSCASTEYMCVFKVSEQNFYNTANSLTTSSELSVMAAMPICPFPEAFAEPTLDYQSVSQKFLASITSNISSTFDYQTVDNTSERGRIGRDRSMEFKPNILDNSIPLCNLRHFATANDEVSREFSGISFMFFLWIIIYVMQLYWYILLVSL